MGLYDRILLPTDGSAGMDRVIDHAAGLARAHDAEIRALYVVDATGSAGVPMETAWGNVRRLLEEEGEAALAAVETRVGDDLRVETATVEGTPSREIARHARENAVDVVVMGTHGRGGIDRLLIGSVAERVVRQSQVPVLTVRVNAEAADETGEDADAATTAPGPGRS